MVTAFVSCWQLSRQSFYRTPFLIEQTNRICFQLFISHQRLTFSVSMIQNEERQRNSIGLLANIKILFDLNLKILIHHQKNFIHSCPLILKQETWTCKKKCILCQSWNTLAMSIFETLGQKLKVLLSIFYVTKITLEWITPHKHPF